MCSRKVWVCSELCLSKERPGSHKAFLLRLWYVWFINECSKQLAVFITRSFTVSIPHQIVLHLLYQGGCCGRGLRLTWGRIEMHTEFW
jgi:hypothetical protein